MGTGAGAGGGTGTGIRASAETPQPEDSHQQAAGPRRPWGGWCDGAAAPALVVTATLVLPAAVSPIVAPNLCVAPNSVQRCALRPSAVAARLGRERLPCHRRCPPPSAPRRCASALPAAPVHPPPRSAAASSATTSSVKSMRSCCGRASAAAAAAAPSPSGGAAPAAGRITIAIVVDCTALPQHVGIKQAQLRVVAARYCADVIGLRTLLQRRDRAKQRELRVANARCRAAVVVPAPGMLWQRDGATQR
eukprot:366098-Chlamydomonas_euryale.AAC.2